MAANSENKINLKTLQRVDSHIIEIIDNTSQVAIYKYEKKLERWEGTDIEGTLFLYRRSIAPYHEFIIVNRMNTKNLIESITSDMQFQLQEPYLLYKNTSDDIIGCWFYEHKDLKRISKKIQTIVLKQTSTSRRQRCASESETQPPKEESSGQDIITLLSQAHEKYMKNVSQSQEPKNNNSTDVNNLSAYSEKHLQKSVPTFSQSKDSPPRTHSQEEYVVSPRRRFMSTGSFDSHQTAAVYRFPRDRSLKADDATENKVQNTSRVDFSNGSRDCSATVLPRNELARLPLFSHNEVSSPVDVREEPMERHYSASNIHPFAHCRRLVFDCQESPGNFDWKTSVEKDAHSTSIKQVLTSHVQDNPKLMLQIHEAYISSLRSLFTKT